MRRSVRTGVLAAVALASFAQARAGDADRAIPPRRYRTGETLRYHMATSNQNGAVTRRFEADATGTVVADSNGGFVEEYAWSGLAADGSPVALPSASVDFRQRLSLAPGGALAIPNLAVVHPLLIGPITDLLTFYADISIAQRQKTLAGPGDHFVFPHGTPVSWADGTYILLGEDSIDFDVTLEAVDKKAKTATLLVRHVPPKAPQIPLKADWMREPVADGPNNWIEVGRTGDGKFAGRIGQETFDVRIVMSLKDGRMISGTIDNPVEVVERTCEDQALTTCGAPERYRILRRVEVAEARR